MKLKLTTALLLLPVCSYAATNVAFNNLNGFTVGYPVVDNNGVPLDSADFSIQVGSFAQDFIDGIGALDPASDDDAVIAAFAPTGSSVAPAPANLPGLFNTSVPDADGAGNSLKDESIFLLLTGPDSNVIVYEFGVTFPEQDSFGNGSVSPVTMDPSKVLFGYTGQDGTGVPVDTSLLPGPLQNNAGFEKGVTFEAIPEPSTGLLAGLAGLALIARRRR